jgi:hypothetical protein
MREGGGLGLHGRNRVTQGSRCGHGRDFRSERFAQSADRARVQLRHA